jgi:hypothetical protein
VPGTGVELFVARAIIEALEGRIWVEERPGGGTIVNMALPRFDDPGTGARTAAPDPVSRAGTRSRVEALSGPPAR